MKTPFACIGFSMLFSLVFAISVHTAVIQTAAVCFAVSVFLFAAKFVGRKNTLSAAVCCLSACIAMIGYTAVVEYYVEPIIDKYSGKTVAFSGTVVSNPYTDGGNTHFTVKTDTVDGVHETVKINVTTSDNLPLEMYDFVEGKATLSSEYESGYGYASYYGARNIFLTTYINSYYGSEYKVIQNNSKPFYVIFNDMRKYIARTFKKYLAYDEASLCTAVITGEKMYLRDDVYSAFKNLGVSHILVVSGLHISIIAAIIYFIAENYLNNKYISALVQIFGVTSFAMLSGFGFSVRRALVMILITIIGGFFFSDIDTLNSLGIAAFLLCLNPLNVGDIGLLWSFSYTLSIVLFAGKMTDYFVNVFDVKNFILLKLTTLFSTSLSAFVGSIPFLILVTGSISPYTILVNVLTVPFTGILIVCGGFAVLFFALNISVLAYLLMTFAGLTAKYLIFVTDTFRNMPYSSVSTNKVFVYIWFAVTAAVITLLMIFDKKKIYLRIGIIAAAAVFMGLYSLNTILDSGKVVFSVLDVGNGMTLTVKNNDNITLLNSYGEKYQYNTIKAELSDFENIACMIDIPPSKTDYNYCRKIMSDFHSDKIIVYDDKTYNRKYSYLKYMNEDIEKISSNYKIYIDDNIVLNIISTETSTWEYLTIYDTEILICPTHADFDELPDIFKNPDAAVISDIPNNFHLEDDVYIVVSAYGEEYWEIAAALTDSYRAIEGTNGEGRIDFEFHSGGKFDVKRIYTGGVTQYGENQ